MAQSNTQHGYREWLSIFDGLDRRVDIFGIGGGGNGGGYEMVEPQTRQPPPQRKSIKSPNFSRLIGPSNQYHQLGDGSIDISDRSQLGITVPTSPRKDLSPLSPPTSKYSASVYSEAPLWDHDTAYRGSMMSPAQKTVSRTYTGSIDDRASIRPPKPWNPIWLHTITLLAFAGLFLSLIVGVLLIWQFATSQRGYTAGDLHLSVLWTYGPTFVIVIVVSLWRQVEYFCKILSPWLALRNGSARPDKSLLVDYLSPFPAVSLWRSLRNRHWSAAAAAIGFWVLKLTVVASSSLLVLGPVLMTNPSYKLQQLTKFDASSYSSAEAVASSEVELFGYYGVLNGAPLPRGMLRGNLVYTQFETPDSLPPNSSLAVESTIFSTNLDCQPAEILNFEDTQFGANFQYRTNDCVPQRMVSKWNDLPAPAPASVVGNRTYSDGSVQIFDCAGTNLSTVTSTTDVRLFVSAFNLTSSVVLQPDDPFQNKPAAMGAYIIGNFRASTKVNNMVGIICKPSYKLDRGVVAYNNSNIGAPTQFELLSRTPTQDEIPGLAQATLAQDVFKIASNNTEGLNFVSLMTSVTGQGSFDSLLNTTALNRTVNEVYSGLAAQLAWQHLTAGAATDAQGQMQYYQQRLFAGTIPIWIMIGGFTVLFLLTIFVYFSRPENVVPYRPDSVSAQAETLQSSPALQQVLRGCGHESDLAIAERLSQDTFTSSSRLSKRASGIFRINVDRKAIHFEPSFTAVKSGWHVPVMARIPTIICVLLLPVIFIAVLEMLQQLSNRHNGFLTLPAHPTSLITREEAARLVSTLAMLLVAALYTGLDFVVVKYTPFTKLKMGRVTGQGLKTSLLGLLPPVVLWRSVKSRYWAVTLSSTAALVGSVLAVVVSGLFVVQEVETQLQLSVISNTGLNVNWTNSVDNDNNAALVFSLIDHFNYTDPRFTFEELALPILDLRVADTQALSKGSRITARIPAWRAGLDCTQISLNSTQVSSRESQQGTPMTWTFPLRAELPLSCQLGGPGANQSFINFNSTVAANVAGSRFAGNMLDLHLGPYPEGYGVEQYGEDTTIQSRAWLDNPAGCPTLAFTFGTFDFGNVGSATESMSSMVCSQHIEEVETEVTLVYPDMTIDQSRLPRPDESTVKLVNVTSIFGKSETALPFRLEKNLNAQHAAVNGDQTKSGQESSGVYLLDSFFSMLLLGKESVSGESISGPANYAAFEQKVQRLYRRYMAQAIAANMRRQLSEPVSFSADVRDFTTQTRLFVVSGPKFALQSMLAFMVIAGGLAYALTPLRRVLMHNPLTLAGTMSLLAGSKMCDAKWQELTSKEHRTYRLGWWGAPLEEQGDNGPGKGKHSDDAEQRFGIDFDDAFVR